MRVFDLPSDGAANGKSLRIVVTGSCRVLDPFEDLAAAGVLVKVWATVLTFPTLSATMTEEQETHLLDVMKVAGGVILSTEHFFRNRTSDEQATLISQIRSRGFGEPGEVFSWANGDMGFAGNRIVFLKRL